MTIETLKERVSNTTKKIEKLEAKLVRINDALNGGNNPYYYDERDLRATTRELETAKASLKDYEERLAIEINKENAPKIEALVKFLDGWKEKANIFYHNEAMRLHEFEMAHREEEKQYENEFGCIINGKEYWSCYKRYTAEKKDQFTADVIEMYVHCGNHIDEEKLEKMLNQEVKAKYDDLVARMKNVVGEIEDCRYLSIGLNGSINGYVIGSNGRAKVETIMAGGYNIQCLHYRVLVNKFN